MKIENQVREFLNHLRVERALSPNTLAAYRRDIEKYQDFLKSRGVTTLEDVDEQMIRQYQDELSSPANGYATTTVARMIASVRGLHKFAIKERWVSRDVTAAFVSVRPGIRLPKALSVQQTIALVEALSTSEEPLDIRDHALIELLYATGARISEAINLEIGDIDVQEQAVRLTGKGGKTRIVPIGESALRALDKYLVRVRPSLVRDANLHLFLNRSGKRLSRQSAFNAVSHAAKLARLDLEVSPHTLRHCYATHLIEGGADVRIVQELLGHASVTTTQIYTLVTAQRLREVYATAHPRALKNL
ncbi:MAG: site-specific tyrosine recombinase XerD [Actinomycetota bacterium]